MRKGLKTQHAIAAATIQSDGEGAMKYANNNRAKTQQPPAADDGTSAAKRDRLKNTCTVSARMRQVVEQMLTCDLEQYALAMQQTTIFAFKSQQSELVLSFLQEMRQENSALYQNKEAFLQLISDAYDKTQALLVV